ncbi:ABC bile acid [Sesbania bispinosa]|nr:ABC bile acid [Sesbania bispinosa]
MKTNQRRTRKRENQKEKRGTSCIPATVNHGRLCPFHHEVAFRSQPFTHRTIPTAIDGRHTAATLDVPSHVSRVPLVPHPSQSSRLNRGIPLFGESPLFHHQPTAPRHLRIIRALELLSITNKRVYDLLSTNFH